MKFGQKGSSALFILFTLAVMFLLLGLAAGNVNAEPMPDKVAVNHETKQCALFFGGDECMECFAPQGWEDLGFYPTAQCPAEYELVEIEPDCQAFKNEFCCSEGHSGVHGDCDDLLINDEKQQCAFVDDINTCSLPQGWASRPDEVNPNDWACPYGPDAWQATRRCSANTVGGDDAPVNWLGIPIPRTLLIGLVAVGGCLSLLLGGAVVFLVWKFLLKKPIGVRKKV